MTASRSFVKGSSASIAVCTCHDLAGFGADHGEAKDTIVVCTNDHLHEALDSSVASVRNTLFIGRLAMRTAMPLRCASPSERPTRASGGSVNMT